MARLRRAVAHATVRSRSPRSTRWSTTSRALGALAARGDARRLAAPSALDEIAARSPKRRGSRRCARATTTRSRRSCCALLRGQRSDIGDGTDARRAFRAICQRAEVLARRDALHARLDAISRRRRRQSRAAAARRAVAGGRASTKISSERAGQLDFLDLLLVARDLVRDNAAVRAELQTRFTHIFVDEFQDTDPLQAEILLLLAADDPAESRLASRAAAARQALRRRRSEAIDLSLSPRRRRALPGASSAGCSTRGAALEHLTVSFRATPEIQPMVNAAFAPVMTAESADAARVRAARRRFARTVADAAVDRRAAGARAVQRLRGVVTNWQNRRVAPDAVARVRRWLVARERLDGDRARGGPTNACRFGRATSAFCFAASSASATTSRGPTCARSRRAMCRTCWSGAARSTSARRSRRCATRWPRSSGPTTSSRSSRRCAARSSRCRDDALLRFREAGRQRCIRFASCLTICPPALKEVARRARGARRPASRAQSPADRRHDRAPARGDARARRRSRSGRPASRRSPT